MTIHPKVREVMRSTAQGLEQLPDVNPEDATKLKAVVVHLATELEVVKTEPLLPSTDTTDN